MLIKGDKENRKDDACEVEGDVELNENKGSCENEK